MKYIKMFENDEKPEFEKYLVFKFPANLIISEFIQLVDSPYHFQHKNMLTLKRLYNVNSDGRIFESDKEKIETELTDEIKKRIIYQSNDLEHVLDIAPTLFYSTKYNL